MHTMTMAEDRRVTMENRKHMQSIGPSGTLNVLAIFWLSLSVPYTLDAQEPSAASAAFRSQDKVVLAALKMVRSGDFASAEGLLSQKHLDADADARRARLELVDILRRIRIEYSLDSAGLPAKVKKSVPDVSGEEVERWAIDSRSRFRMIDGITIRGNHPKIKMGSTVRVWMPYAQECRQQRDVKLLHASPEPSQLLNSTLHGNARNH